MALSLSVVSGRDKFLMLCVLVLDYFHPVGEFQDRANRRDTMLWLGEVQKFQSYQAVSQSNDWVKPCIKTTVYC